jgi:putative membrane-bound dehydrogenase-like protein
VRKRVQKDMPRDMVKGFTPDQAAARMTLPEGFHADLIAGEPRLHQPIAMTFDARGRIWVAEAYSYPVRRADDEARDHILVFEDTNQDGNFDKRTVFMDDLNLVSGLEVGHGGVWIGAAPYLMFVPDRDDDLVPDGEAQILLDGWGYQDTHETLNAFNWGPDGWLYGCHGVFTHSRVGKPGTPDAERTPLNAAVWRYHPQRHNFEVFAWGSSNPWGVDFDDRGQAVITACVIPHLYHVIQGGRYQRQSGQHFNPYVFDDIKTAADHLHYLGATPHSGNGLSDSVGGGHAHCGAAIYLADQFPEEYRNRLFVFNVHGKRMNSELLLPKDSGLIGAHAPDFMLANDKWFLGVALRVGPDGSLYFIDWYDKQACHRSEVEIWDRSNGRMYRVRYGDLKPVKVNLAEATTEELIEYQRHANDWYVRTARRILAERGPDPVAAEALVAMLLEPQTPEVELRLLWALHAVGGLSEDGAGVFLTHKDNPYMRAWTIQLALDQSIDHGTSAKSPRLSVDLLRKLESMAATDESLVVRLYLASALQRLPLEQRRGIAHGLMQHSDSAEDPNLPLLIWYGIEPWVAANPKLALEDMRELCAIPLLQDFTYRRLAAKGGEALDLLCQAAALAPWENAARMIQQIAIALQTHPDMPMPSSWQQLSQRFLTHDGAVVSAQTKDAVTALALGFGDANAAIPLRELLKDSQQPTDRRLRALDGLLQVQDPQLLPILQSLIDDPTMRLAAIQKLAIFDDPSTSSLLLQKLSSFNTTEQGAVATTMASRIGFARQFLQAIVDQEAPGSLLDSASLRLQLAQLDDPTTDELLTMAWGRSTELSAEAAQEIKRYAAMLSEEFLAKADLSNGRAIFKRTCWVCHELFGDGLDLGPGLTGSNRANLDYILTNILDPSAEVAREYLLTSVKLWDGRVVSGMVVEENNSTITLQSGTIKETVRKSQILTDENGQQRITRSPVSLMPPGQLQALSDEEVRDLIVYLASPEQVPLPE